MLELSETIGIRGHLFVLLFTAVREGEGWERGRESGRG